MANNADTRIIQCLSDARESVLRSALRKINQMPIDIVRSDDYLEIVVQSRHWLEARSEAQRAMACCRPEDITGEVGNLIECILDWIDMFDKGTPMSNEIRITQGIGGLTSAYDELSLYTEDILK